MSYASHSARYPHPPLQALSGVSAALGRSVASLTVEAFRTQVVAGLNYKVKAAVDGASVIITAYKPLPHTGQPLTITAVAEGEEL